MIQVGNGSVLRHPIYHDSNGNPRFRRIVYRDANGVGSLAYPPQYCDSHTSQVYPNTNRTLWQPSTIQWREDASVCLGNEGLRVIYYPSGIYACATFNSSTSQFSNVMYCTAVNYYGTVAMSLATVADNAYGMWITANQYKRYRNGTAGVTTSDDYVRADDYVFQRPTLSNVTDELNNGQVSGGASYVYVSLEILVEIPKNFPSNGNIFCDAPRIVDPDDKRPAYVFDEFMDDLIRIGLHTNNRIAKDWTIGDRRFILLDLLCESAAVYASSYSHIYMPYVFFMNPNSGTATYVIHDVLMSCRFVDTIRSGAT